jgi:O-antigen ligase
MSGQVETEPHAADPGPEAPVSVPNVAAMLAAPTPAPFRRRAPAAPRSRGKLRLSRDRLRMSLFLLIVLAISRVYMHVPGLVKARPILVLTALVAGFAFANPRLLVSGSVLRTWPAKVLAGLAVVACLSAPAGISLGNSGRFLIDVFSKIILLTFLIIAATRSVRDLYTFAWSYVIACGILSFFALFVFKLQRYGTDFEYARLANLYTWDANDVVLVLLVGLVLSLLVLQVVRDPLRRLTCLAVMLFIGATVSRSGSRGGFVGLLAVGGALLVMTSGVSIIRKTLVIAVAAAGLVLWAPEGYWQQMETIKDPKADYNYNSIDGRRHVAKRGIQYMKDHPLFGVGISNFQKAECLISDKAKNTPPGHGIRCMPPHNSYVQAGAETGVTGLVLWSSVIFGGILSLRKWGKRLPRRFRTGTEEQRFLYFACQYLPVALVGFAVTSYFLTFAWLEPYYILLALTAGTIHIAGQEHAKARLRAHRVRAQRMAARAARARMPLPVPVAAE